MSSTNTIPTPQERLDRLFNEYLHAQWPIRDEVKIIDLVRRMRSLKRMFRSINLDGRFLYGSSLTADWLLSEYVPPGWCAQPATMEALFGTPKRRLPDYSVFEQYFPPHRGFDPSRFEKLFAPNSKYISDAMLNWLFSDDVTINKTIFEQGFPTFEFVLLDLETKVEREPFVLRIDWGWFKLSRRVRVTTTKRGKTTKTRLRRETTLNIFGFERTWKKDYRDEVVR